MIHQSAEQAILTFGKFKGYSLAHVYYNNQSYLQWMITTVGLPEVWKEAATLTLKGEDISHLKIAKTNNPTSSFTPQVSTDTAVSGGVGPSSTGGKKYPEKNAAAKYVLGNIVGHARAVAVGVYCGRDPYCSAIHTLDQNRPARRARQFTRRGGRNQL